MSDVVEQSAEQEAEPIPVPVEPPPHPSEVPARRRRIRRPPPEFAATAASGMNVARLAEMFDASRPTVSKWLNLPDVMEEIASIKAEIQATTKSRFLALTPKVADVLESVVQGSLGEACPHCGRGADQIAIRDRLRAMEMVLDRIPGLEVGTRSEVSILLPQGGQDADGELLECAAMILEDQGNEELARQIRETMR